MKKDQERVYLEGNNGANYLEIIKTKDNMILIEIGDCCVITARAKVSVEMFTNALTWASLNENLTLVEWMKSKMQWDEETNAKFSQTSKDLQWHEKGKAINGGI